MRAIRRFTVRASLPEPLAGLRALATNLRWTWHPPTRDLFASMDDELFRLVRVCPFPEDAAVAAGPYCCAPTRSGLVVRFRRWATGPADASLH